jgi:hypothetical protein
MIATSSTSRDTDQGLVLKPIADQSYNGLMRLRPRTRALLLRLLLLLLVYAVGGAIINVAVAWGDSFNRHVQGTDYSVAQG